MEIIGEQVPEVIAEIVAEEIPVEWQWERLRVKRDSLLLCLPLEWHLQGFPR